MSVPAGYACAVLLVNIGFGLFILGRRSSSKAKRKLGWGAFVVTMIAASVVVCRVTEDEFERRHLTNKLRAVIMDDFRFCVGDFEVRDAQDVIQDILSLDSINMFRLEMREPILIRVASRIETGVEETFWVQQSSIRPAKFNVIRDRKTRSAFGTFQSERLGQIVAQRETDEQK